MSSGEFHCERCGVRAAASPWPKGWTQCGRSRYPDAPSGIASWCPACGLLMPAGSMGLYGRFDTPIALDGRSERVVIPPRLPDYTGADILILPAKAEGK